MLSEKNSEAPLTRRYISGIFRVSGTVLTPETASPYKRHFMERLSMEMCDTGLDENAFELMSIHNCSSRSDMIICMVELVVN